ncbi:MAG TPA: hypothetical protein PK611_03330 [Saprospiraceae bacterium]|nr:hypothetical protein [Saprospiraceae bacterium]HRO08221.1 hypothetical protein [Saprospiraceae bacterium]HRO72680.1 hypothetical protein [Saprospiraceae bacterium]HRP41112.1 hypothetical protein [Saprospiraceae bacterium]
MKHIILRLFFGLVFISGVIHASSFAQGDGYTKPTSVGIVLYSNDTETVWNALRLANFSKSEQDTVTVFLLAKGVELENMLKQNQDLKEQADLFIGAGGTILGCGTCLSSRNMNNPQIYLFIHERFVQYHSSKQDCIDFLI